ncbi:heparinase II/III domain-containing protein [Chryseosolibacter indicus]|uniref:Heparinase II/III family protein n=1 Tax=Chryseosolibacter indicus TaxID=2782351 RepID=A0ABS5VQQ6_9BACT|nr:heparinase II/III family protein [Chryseosolibacter indicus]MBT1703772.1 heparinase II/III family protein [Chryseosolibacter indicus]
MRNLPCVFLMLFVVPSLMAQQNLLSGKYKPEELKKVLIPLAEWHPFPKLDDREGWSKADQQTLQAYLRQAENYINYEWPYIPATKSLLIARTGDRDEYQTISFKKREVLGLLLFAEIAENKGRFIDPIIDGVWSICEESFWGVPAHLPQSKEYAGLMDVSVPFVDLFAAETATYLAWVDYYLGDKLDAVSPQIRKRIYFETNNRVFQPLLTKPHGWMKTNDNGRRPNNWNPWICSNWLNSVLLLEKNEDKRAEGVHKALMVLDEYLNPHPLDGGCDEGPSYWGAAAASLYDNIALLNLTTKDAYSYVFRDEKFRNMGKFIYRAQISEKYFLNFADADPQPGLSATMIYRYGKDIRDEDMMKFGAYYRKPNDGLLPRFHYFRNFFSLFIQQEYDKAAQGLPLPKDVWLPDLQVMAARDYQGSTKGFFMAAKGGNNDESHNHNDIGNFVVYYDGQPLLIDVGRGTYTRKTFSARRYEIWYNCSDYHNVPTINGKTQPPGGEFKATNVEYKQGKSFASFSLDISKSYPQEAHVTNFKRTIRLNRSKSVTVEDVINLSAANELTEHLMTSYPSEVTKAGEVIIHYKTADGSNKDFKVRFNNDQLEASIEKVPLTAPEDKGILAKWGDTIYRINFRSKVPKTTDKISFEIAAK